MVISFLYKFRNNSLKDRANALKRQHSALHQDLNKVEEGYHAHLSTIAQQIGEVQDIRKQVAVIGG